MYIGIIVACMPSASRSCHHLLPAYESLKTNFLSSRLLSIGQKLRFSAQASSKNDSTEYVSRKYDGNYNTRNKRPYKHLEEYKRHFSTTRNPTSTKIMQTFTNGESQHVVENDGIHLTYEMQQSDYRLGTDAGSSTWYATDEKAN